MTGLCSVYVLNENSFVVDNNDKNTILNICWNNKKLKAVKLHPNCRVSPKPKCRQKKWICSEPEFPLPWSGVRSEDEVQDTDADTRNHDMNIQISEYFPSLHSLHALKYTLTRFSPLDIFYLPTSAPRPIDL